MDILSKLVVLYFKKHADNPHNDRVPINQQPKTKIIDRKRRFASSASSLTVGINKPIKNGAGTSPRRCINRVAMPIAKDLLLSGTDHIMTILIPLVTHKRQSNAHIKLIIKYCGFFKNDPNRTNPQPKETAIVSIVNVICNFF